MNSVDLISLKEDLGVDDWRVIPERFKMEKHFGYLPAYAKNLPDQRLAADQVGWLIQAFPGYKWKVQVRDTILTCLNETLSGNWGFTLRVRMLDNHGKVIRWFGASLLERYGMRRDKANLERILEASRDLRGNMVRV